MPPQGADKPLKNHSLPTGLKASSLPSHSIFCSVQKEEFIHPQNQVLQWWLLIAMMWRRLLSMSGHETRMVPMWMKIQVGWEMSNHCLGLLWQEYSQDQEQQKQPPPMQGPHPITVVHTERGPMHRAGSLQYWVGNTELKICPTYFLLYQEECLTRKGWSEGSLCLAAGLVS